MRSKRQGTAPLRRTLLPLALTAVALALLLSATALLPAGAEDKAGRKVAEETKSYPFKQRERKFIFSKEHLGYVLNRQVNPEEAGKVVADTVWKGKPIPYKGGLWLIRAESPLTLAQIRDKAIQLKRDKQQVVDAGLVFRFPGRTYLNLLTGKIVVRFKPGTSQKEVDALLARLKTKIDRQEPFDKREYRLQLLNPAEGDPIAVAAELDRNKLVEAALPHFIELHPLDLEEGTPSPMAGVCKPWHHDNRGLDGRTADADLDTVEAWQITEGSEEVVIAVIDDGFQTDHPELKDNLWRNPDELPNGKDDDGNGLIDDIHGYDFASNDPDPSGPHGDHGTKSAGCACARGNNLLGICGTAPRCRLMLLRVVPVPSEVALAIRYARSKGASVISISLAQGDSPNLRAAIKEAVKQGRSCRGCVILFAMRVDPVNQVNACLGDYADIIVDRRTLAVSGCTAREEKYRVGTTQVAFGNCMDVLAPMRGLGRHHIATIQPTSNSPIDCPQGYFLESTGTSSATPLTAGVAGLVLSVRPELSWRQVHRLLQDTCDKIEDDHGHYDPQTGFSKPPSDGVATHGFGRVNAFEAVRVVAPRVKQGRGGTDLFLRDNRLDWGNTEQPSHTLFGPTTGFIPHSESVDIKVDPRPMGQPPADSVAFDGLPDASPRAGACNKVYVRVRNRGPYAAVDVKVKLYVTPTTTPLPPLSEWTPIDGEQSIPSVPYSGCSVAARKKDKARIVAFNWPAPAANGGRPTTYSLLAVATCDQDPASTPGANVSEFVARDNNVTMKNVVIP